MNNVMKFANLLEHAPLDREIPDGNANLKLLEAVLTDEEARIAILCPNEYRSSEEIAAATGEDLEHLQQMLERLTHLGMIVCYAEDGVTVKYKHCEWMPGISEHFLLIPEHQTPEMAKLWEEHTVYYSDSGAPLGGALGGAPMRTIPIEESIEANSTLLSWEDLQYHLDKSDIYSAAPCECRLSQKLLGNACEHPIEETCVQIGPQADYYIRTGRGKRKTRAEIEVILRNAEKAGLVHNAFLCEGKDLTPFICNCCSCACLGLRVATKFQNTDALRSNFVAIVDPEKCVGCGSCVEKCNLNAAVLGSALCKENQVPDRESIHDTEWTEEYWDFDYLKRKMVNEYGTAPCKTACPAHISVQGYIRKAQEGKFDEALKVIKRDNPFPAICGRVCPHDCEKECTRAELDEAIAIDDIKKFIADKEIELGHRYTPEMKEKRTEKIAIIGSGPSGLTCAYYLAVDGFDVTVYEKENVLGGMMTLGIPNFRLEKTVVNAEIDVLREMGIKFITGVDIGKDKTIADLRAEGFKAFFIGIGAQGARALGVEGENGSGVISGVDFLRNIALGKETKLSGKTLVIGGGNVAIDVARAALRVSDDRVEMVCLEQREEMPALPEEQEEAIAEGVILENGWGPQRILTENGKVVGVMFKRCVSAFNEYQHFAPIYNEQDTMIIECANVIVAIGQSIEHGTLLENTAVKTGRGGTIVADPMTLQTDDADIFTGGDVLTGPKFAINAIASGKTAAGSIYRYLLNINMTLRREREYHPLDKENLELDGYDRLPRQRTSDVSHENAKSSFNDLRVSLTEEQVMKESNRCLGCGISVIDEYRCMGCGVCHGNCEFDAIHLVRKFDIDAPETPEDFMNKMFGYMMERNERVAAKKALQSQEV